MPCCAILMIPGKWRMLQTCFLLAQSRRAYQKRLISVCPHHQSFTDMQSSQFEDAAVSVELLVLDETNSVANLIEIMQKCRKERDLMHAQRIHAHLCSNGIEAHKTLGNFLVPMLVECGSVLYAKQGFDKLVSQNEYSWTSLMQGFLELGQYQHAMDLFLKMQERSIHPSKITVQLLLRLSLSLNCLESIHLAHEYIIEKSFDNDLCVGNVLVDTYAKIGVLVEAKVVFDGLSVQDVVSWTSLMTGYAEHCSYMDALHFWEHMQVHGVSPNIFTVASTLNVCGSSGAVDKGQDVHAFVIKEGFEGDVCVGNALIDLYCKCGYLEEAQDVFDEMSVRDEFSWTALVSGYGKHGLFKVAHECLEQMKEKSYLTSWNALMAEYAELTLGEEALECFDCMKEEGLQPDAISLTCGVKACGKVRCLTRGRSLHIEVVNMGYEKDTFTGNALVDMYGKCGSLLEAQRVFDKLQMQDVVSWTALISGYSEHGLFKVAESCLEEMKGEGVPFTVTMWNALIAAYGEVGLTEEAFDCFERMQLEGILPNSSTYLSILKSCGWAGASGRGEGIYVKITKEGLDVDPLVGGVLIDFYGKCGMLAEVFSVFNFLPFCDEVAWNALLGALAERGHVYECVDSLQWMERDGVTPSVSAFTHCLQACQSEGELTVGQSIYGKIVMQGLDKDEAAGILLIGIYSKHHLLSDAEYVFYSLVARGMCSWNALVAAYSDQGYTHKLLECFREMQHTGIIPEASTYACSLADRDNSLTLGTGQQIHAEIAKAGFEGDSIIGDMLVHLYAKYGFWADAQKVLHELPSRRVASWTALIAGYAHCRLCHEVLRCFEQIQLEGLSPRQDTFVWGFKACGNARDTTRGYSMHRELLKRGLEMVSYVGNSLVDMYMKFGFLVEAKRVFDSLPDRNVVSFNTVIMGFAENGLNEEALECAKKMQTESWAGDAITFVGILKACGNLGAVYMGQLIYINLAIKGFDTDSLVSSALVDMYVKGGLLHEAWEVFKDLPVKDTVLWTSLMNGYVCQGDYESVFELSDKINDQSTWDCIVVLSLLTVCAHEGLVEQGQGCFEFLIKEQGLVPTHELNNSFIDLLARAGQLTRASGFLASVPFQPSLMNWITMLGACRKWGDIDLGVQAFDCASELFGTQASPYILMSNLFAEA